MLLSKSKRFSDSNLFLLKKSRKFIYEFVKIKIPFEIKGYKFILRDTRNSSEISKKKSLN